MPEIIGTHHGMFHADDVFAVAILTTIWPDATIIRSRDENLLNSCKILVDVGNSYNHDKGRYDHHQKGGAGKRANGIPYASCGLIWEHFGIILTDANDEVFQLVDETLIQGIDALDNGIDLIPKRDDGVIVFTISSMIGEMNPAWNEPQDFDSAFHCAVESAKGILKRVIARAQARVMAKSMVCMAVRNAEDPRLVVLDYNLPWGEILIGEAAETLFVVYPAETGDSWRVQCVRKNFVEHTVRQELPESWAGKTNGELQAATRVKDSTFCHNKRFIAGAKSREGALALAHLALSE